MSWFGKGQNQEAAESPDSFANEDGEDASKLQVWKNHPRSSKHLSVIETKAKEEKPKGPLIRLDSKCNRLGTQPIKAKQTNVRKWWVRFVWLMTFWIPSFLLQWRGMNHSKIRMAWREKVTLCALIAFLWGSVLFLNIGLAPILCPKIKQFTPEELSYFQSPEELYVGIRGKVYDITHWAQRDHAHGVGGVAGPIQMQEFGGKDISNSFPIPLSVGCVGLVKDESMKLRTNLTKFNGFVHDVGPDSALAEGTQLGQANWFRDVALPMLKRAHKGELVYKWDDLKNMRLKESRQVGVIGDRVFDLTDYFQTLDYVNLVGGATSQVAADYHFLDPQVEQIFHFTNQNIDMTNLWNSKIQLTPQKKAENYSCLLTEFYIGKVDNRDSFRCVFTGYMLYAMAWVILGIVLIKFLASLQLGSKRDPQNYQKFVICQVPCYTEGEEGLRKNINSLTCMDYSDHHKLLFIITDGMIIGSGNDRPTPKIVLDILGVDESSASEVTAKSFISVGEGNLQHNMAKIYSGLYEYGGHKVPFLVVVKVGAPGELIRPGNRGKRDSQVVLLRFLNKVFFDREMNPLELEMYHQLKNVIGVPPHLYEYILMIDADTQVAPDALTRLVACMHHDAKIAGICGETQLANPEQSLTTMIQIYEYFISHHMSKAFESLFGSVTCLPGCFCLYRIRTPIFSNLNGDDDGPAQKVQPLIISDQVIDSYSVNEVDTLHDKNLLMLGEDRYLTTLMLKYFPRYKLKFTSDARCKTIAPDQVKVLISQRRRWINSTIHNLWELMGLRQLCGVCLASLRFVVFIDLFGTLVMPAMIGYLVYLVYHVVSEPNDVPGLVTVITLAAIYGSQIVIFVLKRKWSHIGWMIVHTFALPLFYVFLPMYSFWHFDDFSWGNTRRVNGQKPTGKGHDQKYNWDTEFDPSTIPLMRWSDYE
ncbi:glycosyltransferase family 2 protein, partial [Conidiobolus coronatus NRRL 28638]